MSSSLFRFSNPQQQQQQTQPLQQQQSVSALQQAQGGAGHIHLMTKERMPVSYQAKWADLHPDSQQLLLYIEERVREYREESRRLEQRECVSDSNALHKSFEFDAARIMQELGAVGDAVEREAAGVREGQGEASLQLLRHAEVAVRSFLLLRPRFAAAQAQLYDFYSGPPAKPSMFLQQTVARFEHQLSEYRQRVEELERLLLASSDKEPNFGSQLSLLQSLPTVMTNVHDFFIHVAAEVESLHQQTGAMTSAYLVEKRRHGDDSNPFIEAERRAVAQRDAAAKRVLHPTLHLPPPQPASTPAATTSSAFGTSFQQPALTATPPTLFSTPTTPAPSIFNTTASNTTPAAGASSQPLFGSSFAPALQGGLFGTSTTPSTGLFGASSGAPATQTPSLFGAPASTSSLFGTPAATSSLFGTPAATNSLFGTPAATTSLFGTPAPTFGAANTAPLTGMGSTGATAAAKPKPRGARRK
ncbi:unnamed protein product [Sphagnum jensenii]|uniref:Uncharacterized protein n=2 Tax=Sphagnum jensenii TaxID=128206 RepID=A0ABP1A0X3_9BRYO